MEPSATKQDSAVFGAGRTILKVRDLPAAARWYAEMLGVQAPPVDAETPRCLFRLEDGVDLLLDDLKLIPEPGDHPICTLLSSDIERSYAWALGRGIPIVRDLARPRPGSAFFFARDSEGNVIAIAQSDEAAREAPFEPISPDHPLRNRLESIVIPVEDLKRATEWYAALLGRAIKPERQDGGPIYWFEMDRQPGILLDDNRMHREWRRYPTFMLRATDVQAAFRLMRDAGVRILTDIEFNHHFFAEDPEGHSFAVCQQP